MTKHFTGRHASEPGSTTITGPIATFSPQDVGLRLSAPVVEFRWPWWRMFGEWERRPGGIGTIVAIVDSTTIVLDRSIPERFFESP